jgi:hypothetical protein
MIFLVVTMVRRLMPILGYNCLSQLEVFTFLCIYKIFFCVKAGLQFARSTVLPFPVPRIHTGQRPVQDCSVRHFIFSNESERESMFLFPVDKACS